MRFYPSPITFLHTWTWFSEWYGSHSTFKSIIGTACPSYRTPKHSFSALKISVCCSEVLIRPKLSKYWLKLFLVLIG